MTRGILGEGIYACSFNKRGTAFATGKEINGAPLTLPTSSKMEHMSCVWVHALLE